MKVERVEVPVETIVPVPDELTQDNNYPNIYIGMPYSELEEEMLYCASQIKSCNVDKAKIRGLGDDTDS